MSSTDTLGRSLTIGRLSVLLGCLAVLFPTVYMSIVGWNSGEHANVVITFGVFFSAILAAIWAAIWKTCGDLSTSVRQRTFGIGATISLLGSIIAGNAARSIAVAGAIYVTIALLAVVATRRTSSRTYLR